MKGLSDYPTVAMVNEADAATLQSWHDNLPEPIDYLQRTTRRRIIVRLASLAAQAVQDRAPEVTKRFNDIMETFERITGRKQSRMNNQFQAGLA